MSYTRPDYIIEQSPEEETLCRLARQGDREAAEQLAVQYMPLVKACARPYFLAGGDSEDLIQEGMLGLLKAIRSYDPERGVPFGAFARICVNSRMISAVRSADSAGQRPLNHSESISGQPLVDEPRDLPADAASAADPAQLIISMEEQRERMEQLSRLLSAFENRVLVLFLKGLSYNDMAEQLGKPVKSVDNAIQRIRRKAAPILHGGDSQ